MDKSKVKYGKNAAENWRLYEVADEEDLWFHVDDEPSAHVILEDPYTHSSDEEVIYKCASLCVERTPKLRERGSVKVIYTKIGNLKKGKSVGELIIQDVNLVKSINVKRDKSLKK